MEFLLTNSLFCFSHFGRTRGYQFKVNLKNTLNIEMSRLVRKPTMWFPNTSDTNQAVQSQKQARSLKFRISEEEEVYYPCSENKGADQLRGFRRRGNVLSV